MNTENKNETQPRCLSCCERERREALGRALKWAHEELKKFSAENIALMEDRNRLREKADDKIGLFLTFAIIVAFGMGALGFRFVNIYWPSLGWQPMQFAETHLERK